MKNPKNYPFNNAQIQLLVLVLLDLLFGVSRQIYLLECIKASTNKLYVVENSIEVNLI